MYTLYTQFSECPHLCASVSRGVLSNTSTCLMIRRQSFGCCIQLTMLISGYAKSEAGEGDGRANIPTRCDMLVQVRLEATHATLAAQLGQTLVDLSWQRNSSGSHRYSGRGVPGARCSGCPEPKVDCIRLVVSGRKRFQSLYVIRIRLFCRRICLFKRVRMEREVDSNIFSSFLLIIFP